MGIFQGCVVKGTNVKMLPHPYPLKSSDMNGKFYDLGKINLQSIQGDGDSGKGKFEMCLVDQDTGAVTAAEKFV